MRYTILSLALLVVMSGAGCDQINKLGATNVKDITDHIRDYEGKTVTVAGEAREGLSVPFVPYKLYQLKDETGDIYIVTEKAVPKAGEKMRVTGKVNQAFTVGMSQMIVIVEGENKN